MRYVRTSSMQVQSSACKLRMLLRCVLLAAGLRVNHAAMMVVEVQQWISANFPYWKRRGGKDHIWLFTHDEGGCCCAHSCA